jgi:two-component system cell cycle sensor histidine kinase/response regulator CckA
MSVNDTDKGVILIVDDTPTNLEMLFDFLADSGFTVLVAEDGESAIERAQYAPPDLILLDVLMPGMDGFETCRRLKINELTKDIPIIFMTALSETGDKIKGLNIGAVDYITKPLQHEEVLARVELHLRLQNLTKALKEQNLRLEREISERIRAEQKIGEQAALLDITTDAILVRDLNNYICFWNKGAEDLYGWKSQEAIGKNANQLLYREETLYQLQNIHKTLAEYGSWQGELTQINKEGKEIIVASRWTLMREQDGQSKSILTVNTNITEKKEFERQFLRAQRLESIGTLAGGIAHDLNNILTPILMSAQLLRLKNPNTDERSQQMFSTIETNAKRGAALVKQVLQFARGVEGQPRTVQLSHLFSEIRQIVRETFPKSIELYMDIDRNLWSVFGDATHLHQMLMNLVVNARDAMPNGGTLSICAENLFINEHYARMNLDACVGPYIMITITDTGIGMAPEILDRIFEPFFTTKEVGKGTGLGLSIVRGIVKNHGGFVNMYSKVGRGTEFKIFLPAQEAKTTQLTETHLDLPRGNGELILVVDDEDEILETTKILLRTYNYKVLTAKDGIEAMALFTEYKNEISVVLIDMMMPLMDGATTIRVLHKINSHVSIIAVSGLVASNKLTEVKGVETFISKPYTTKELLQVLHNILHHKSKNPAIH